MDQAVWIALTTWLAIAIITPLGWEASQRPRRSGGRVILAGVALVVAGLALSVLLRYSGLPRIPDLVLLLVIEAGAVAIGSIGVRRAIRARRAERNPRIGPDQLITDTPRLWVRPHQPEVIGRGPLSRVDQWLAADGPRPTAGWWHNGGLLLDTHGPALVDAAGLRHTLPARVTTMLNPNVPRSLVLLDERQHVLVRLPTTGFDSAELRQFASAADWRYTSEFVEFVRDAPDNVDLRRSVVDHLAKDEGAVRRLARHFHRA